MTALVRLQKIVSGGQTGVDRAALDAALACGYAAGGWCPQGRWAEDGVIDPAYPLTETPRADPAQRTAWNVRDSDGTLVLASDGSSPGTSLTVDEARRRRKALLVVDLAAGARAADVVAWLGAHPIGVLNVAGPRESEAPGVYESARVFLLDVLERLRAQARQEGP